MLLKSVSSFSLSTLKVVKRWAFLKLVMVGHRGGKGTRGFNVVTMTRHELSQVHLYVLNNTAEVIPYIDSHKKNDRNEPKNEHDEDFASA